MQEWIGYALAIVLAGIVLLILASLLVESDDVSVGATQFAAGKQVSLNTAAMIQADFRNIGANYPDYSFAPDSAILSIDTTSSIKHFEFMAQVNPTEPPVPVRYEWFQNGTVEVDGTTVPAYRLIRYVDGRNSGSSAGAITRFSLTLQTSSGLPVSDLGETRQIAVVFRSVSSLGSGLTSENRWNGVIRPFGLTRYNPAN